MIKIPELRLKIGDRAILRALHFLQENRRVYDQVIALEQGNFKKFLDLVRASGNSSFKWLQNIYTTKNIKEQGLSLAIVLTENFIEEINEGACRVHGGGFAGTIQVFLPEKNVEEYRAMIEPLFGEGMVKVLNISSQGTIHFNSLL